MSKISAVLLLLCFVSNAACAEPPPSPEPTAHELLAILNERSLANNQRFEAQEKAVAAALAAAKEAVTKAEVAAEKRFDAVNEFRSTLKDQQATLMPRQEAVALLKALEEKVLANDARINQVVNRWEGASWLWGLILGGGGLAMGILGAIFAFRRIPGRTGH
jgi:hypothetical protein